MKFADENGLAFPDLNKRSAVVIPIASEDYREKDSHHVSGLTGVRLGSDLISSSAMGSVCSSMIEADTNQTLHSYRDKGKCNVPAFTGT